MSNENMNNQGVVDIEKQSYWKQKGQQAKNLWCKKRGCDRKSDIIEWCILPFAGLAGLLLALVLLILNRISKPDSMLGGTTMLIACIIIGVISLGVGLAFLIKSAKDKKGWFINGFQKGGTALSELNQKEITADKAVSDGFDELGGKSEDISELDDFDTV